MTDTETIKRLRSGPRAEGGHILHDLSVIHRIEVILRLLSKPCPASLSRSNGRRPVVSRGNTDCP